MFSSNTIFVVSKNTAGREGHASRAKRMSAGERGGSFGTPVERQGALFFDRGVRLGADLPERVAQWKESKR